MFRMQLGLVVAAAVGAGSWWTPASDAATARTVQGTAAEPAEAPRAPWLQGDPADSIYRAAREALNQREYRTAADLFAQIPARFPRSGYAPDAFYWQAFSLYRLGGEPQLRAALDALRRQRERFAGAATKGDAAALEQRIQGVLARRGDEAAAMGVTAAAEAAAMSAEHAEHVVEASGPTSGHGDGRCEDDGDDMKIAAINALAFVEMMESGFTRVAEFHYLHNDADGRRYADPAEKENASEVAKTLGLPAEAGTKGKIFGKARVAVVLGQGYDPGSE